MSEYWAKVALGDAGRWVSGGTPRTSESDYWDGNIPWMSSKSLTEFRVRDSDRRLTPLGAQNGTKLVPAGTILMVVRGMSLKTEFRMGITQREVALSQDLKGLIPRDDLNAEFLAYALQARSDAVLLMVDEAGHGTGRLQSDRLFALEIPLPPIEEQRAIAATLSALDDKIESNRQAIELALAVADAHYQRVAPFVEEKKLHDHATLVLGGTPSRKRPELWENGTVPWIASGAANADIVMEPTEYITQTALDGSAAKLMPKGATVIAITGATLGQIALLGIDTSGNQSLVGVWGEDEATTAWLHFALRASMDELVRSATGAAQQHVNKGNVGDLRVPIPTSEQLQAWSEVCVPLLDRAILLSAESRRLSALRDVLLPELLSGRIRAGLRMSTQLHNN